MSMGEEFQAEICGGSWWNRSRSVLFSAGASPCSMERLNTKDIGFGSMGSYNTSCSVEGDITNTEMRSNNSSVAAHDGESVSASNMGFQDIIVHKPNQRDGGSGGGSGSILIDSTLQMMGFGLSSSTTSSISNWNIASGGRKGESNINSLLQLEDHKLDSQIIFPKSFSSNCNQVSNNPTNIAYKPSNMNQHQFEALTSSGFPIVSSPSASNSYGISYPSTLIHGILDGNNNPHVDHQGQTCNSMFNNMSYPSRGNYGAPLANSNDMSVPNNPSFVKSSMSILAKQPIGGLHFSNNTPFWNASTDSTSDDNIRAASIFSSSQPPYLGQTYDHDQKSSCPNFLTKTKAEEVLDSGSVLVKKNINISEPAPLKRPRIETPSPLPTFKVRKEKLGDRITALQQLVSPFGKTDTASVLREAIEYIKLLHDQVSVLSTPYMKNGASIQHQQGNCDNNYVKEGEVVKQDLKSRGLCLVPISSTFPLANETTADFWTPTFGGTFR